MNILSIDSGVEKTGFSIFRIEKNNFKLVSSGLIRTKKAKKLEERLHEIYERLNDIINNYRPQKIILEQLFFIKNQKTAISVGQAQGVMMLAASIQSIPVIFLAPLQIKLAVTGYGRADKKSVRKMLELTLNVDKKIKEDDEIDAIACGLAYCYLNQKN